MGSDPVPGHQRFASPSRRLRFVGRANGQDWVDKVEKEAAGGSQLSRAQRCWSGKDVGGPVAVKVAQTPPLHTMAIHGHHLSMLCAASPRGWLAALGVGS